MRVARTALAAGGSPADSLVARHLARHSFVVVESTIPPDVAIADWRRQHEARRPPTGGARRWARRVARLVVEPSRSA